MGWEVEWDAVHVALRCSRCHVGGWGWRRRQSVRGQPWLTATEQQSPPQCYNNTSMAEWLQLLTFSPGQQSRNTKEILKRKKRVFNPLFHPSLSEDRRANKTILDHSGLRAVNIPPLIRLSFHRREAAPESQKGKMAAEDKLTLSVHQMTQATTYEWVTISMPACTAYADKTVEA